MHTIVTVTMNPTIDTHVVVDHVIPDRKLRCQAPRHEPGGGGLNVSRAMHQLGGASLALYLGGGPTGQMLHHLLAQEGLTTLALPIADWTRESFVVLEEASGQQYLFVTPGPTVQEREWQQCLDTLAKLAPPPDYIVASGSLPPGVPVDFYARVARLAKACGARAVIDTSGEALRAAGQEGVYLLKPNLQELSDLAARDLVDEAHQEAAALELVHQGQSEVVVLSLGPAGVLLVSAAGCLRLRAPTVRVASKVGAGDSTVAGIVWSLAQGASVRDATLFGVATGAAAVMTYGTGLSRREDVEQLYQRLVAESA